MRHAAPRHSTGMAAVLVIFAIVGILAAVLIYNSLGTVSKRLDAAQTGATSFQKIHDALVRYVMLNQRLPCPASGTAQTGDADPNTATATCNTPAGVVPWNSLGLDKTDAIDPWGRYIFYRVYDGASGFTQANGLSLHNCLDETVSTVYALSGAGSTCNSITHENTVSDFFVSKGLTVNDMGTAKAQVAYALISAGESGLGAFYPGGSTALSSPSTSSKEYLNAGSGGTYWITAASDPSVAATDAAHFDDVVSYAFANDVAKHAQLAGRPWKLYQVFTQSTLGLSSTYNTGSSSVKVQPASAGTNQGPVMVTASGSSTRYVCATNMPTQGLAPCATATTNGSDHLTTAGNESLTFDFRVTRSTLVIGLTDFRYTGGGSIKEQAQLTFYNAAGTQVDQRTVQACSSGGSSVAQFTITPAASFTKVSVTALTEIGSASSSDFAVAAIMACKQSSDCPIGSAPAVTVTVPPATSVPWPAIDCFG